MRSHENYPSNKIRKNTLEQQVKKRIKQQALSQLQAMKRRETNSTYQVHFLDSASDNRIFTSHSTTQLTPPRDQKKIEIHSLTPRMDCGPRGAGQHSTKLSCARLRPQLKPIRNQNPHVLLSSSSHRSPAPRPS